MKKIYLICTTLFVFSGLFAAEDDYESTKTIIKTVGVSKGATVEVYNKYGNIHVNTWQKDSVKIVVDVSSVSSKAIYADKQLDRVRINISNVTHFVVAKTIYGSTSSIDQAVSDILDLGRQLMSYQSKVTINYTLFVPSYIDLKIENRFGDVYIPAIDGKVFIDLSYGDLKAKEIKNAGDVSIKYSNGSSIDKVSSGKLKISYSDMIFEELVDVDLELRSSDIMINHAAKILLTSNHDKITISDLGVIEGTINFTNLKVYQVEKSMNLNTKYGDVYVSKSLPSCTAIKLNGSYTDYAINLSQESSATISVTNDASSVIMLPTKAEISNQSSTQEFKVIEAKLGAGATSISIMAKSSDVKITRQ